MKYFKSINSFVISFLLYVSRCSTWRGTHQLRKSFSSQSCSVKFVFSAERRLHQYLEESMIS